MKAFLKYHLKDKWTLWRQKQRLERNTSPPILVFTMAKVGSLSVYNSLQKYRDNTLFHIHSLNEKEELKHIENCKQRGVFPGSRTPVFLINSSIIQIERPYKIISLIRNPIERNLSAFFDAFEFHLGISPSNYTGTLQYLENAFHEKVDHNYAVQWFEKQFFEGTGIDIYANAFDKNTKWATYTNTNPQILLLRSDLPDPNKETAVSQFCGLSDFNLQNVNVTSTKKEAGLYQQFKEHIRFSKVYLESQLETPYMQHFFTEEEKEAAYKKWIK